MSSLLMIVAGTLVLAVVMTSQRSMHLRIKPTCDIRIVFCKLPKCVIILLVHHKH